MTAELETFVNLAIESGGSIHPLVIPSKDLKGPALMNPTIYLDGDKLLVNLRNINYTLYHSERKKFEHHWGPLVYIHPENDCRLRTWNIVCEIDENMRIIKYHHIDTSDFPDKQLWEFVGLEDVRIMRWNDKLYTCGVRRDLETTGIGRMELCEIVVGDNYVKQVGQIRVPTTDKDDSYCEKNWMPVLDMPYHFLKWTNGTQIVKYDLETKKTETVVQHDFKDLGCADLRGGSQVIRYDENYRFCLTHETFLTQSPQWRKDGVYRHRFVVFDNNWNIVKVSRRFSFLNADIEFGVGMVEYKGDYLITFGYQDNASYLVRAPKDFVKQYIFAE